MELHLRCLYLHDAEGRMLCTRESARRRPPRFHLGRTSVGNLWRFRDDLEPATLRGLARLAGREAPLGRGGPSEGEPPERSEALRRLLREHEEIRFEWCGPTYRFPVETPLDPRMKEASGRVPAPVAVAEGDEGLLERNFAHLVPDLMLRQPCFAVVLGGHAISLCCSVRLLTPGEPGSVGSAAEAGVETISAHRAQGHAARAVLAWTRAVQALEMEPLYSTSWTNLASRSVASRLGLIPYGEDFHLA
jgi:hypothetical protein